MLESIFLSLISSAIYDIIKKNIVSKIKSEKEIVENNQDFVNRINSFILNNLSETEKGKLNLYINDKRFQNALSEYLVFSKIENIIKYFTIYLIPGDNQEQIVSILTKIKRLFDADILINSQNSQNKELINYSVNKIIPVKLIHFEDNLQKGKGFNEKLYQQLKALLERTIRLFDKEKSLYGERGINPRVVVEIARLEYEIKKLFNGRSN